MDSLSTKERLLRVAEKLFAIEGIGAVSMRRICIEAGQKNNNALQYHFGDRNKLIEAILADRMTAINAQREKLLEEIVAQGHDGDLRHLVAAMILPFAAQLEDRERGCYYVRFSAQLFGQGRALALLSESHPWTESSHRIVAMIRKCLSDLPEEILMERLTLMANQFVHATAAKEIDLSRIDPSEREHSITRFANNLIDYVVGGLTAPVITHDLPLPK